MQILFIGQCQDEHHSFHREFVFVIVYIVLKLYNDCVVNINVEKYLLLTDKRKIKQNNNLTVL